VGLLDRKKENAKLREMWGLEQVGLVIRKVN